MDDFLKATKCDRCGGTLEIRQLSKMNTDILCSDCSEAEKKHPRYKEASDREVAEVMKGNRNYKGLFADQKYPFNK